MLLKDERLRLKKLLAEAVPLLCKNCIGVQVESNFCVEAMIGITMDDCQVAVICFKETMSHDGKVQSHVYGTDVEERQEDDVGCSRENDDYENDEDECQLIDEPAMSSSYHEGAASHSSSSVHCNNSSSLVESGYKSRSWNAIKHENNAVSNVGNEPNVCDEYEKVDYKREGKDRYNDIDVAIQSPPSQSRTHQEQRNKNAQQQRLQIIKEELREESEQESFQIDHQLGNAEDWGYSADGYEGESTTDYGGDSADYGEGDTKYQMSCDNSASGGSAPKRMRFPTQQKGYGGSRVGHRSRPWRRGPLRGGGALSANVSNYKSPSSSSTAMSNTQGGAERTNALKKMCQTIASQAQVEQQFVCHICNAKLANKPSLVTHIKGSHIAESLFQCEHCDKRFNWYMQLYRHKKRYHSTAMQNFGPRPGTAASFQQS